MIWYTTVRGGRWTDGGRQTKARTDQAIHKADFLCLENKPFLQRMCAGGRQSENIVGTVTASGRARISLRKRLRNSVHHAKMSKKYGTQFNFYA